MGKLIIKAITFTIVLGIVALALNNSIGMHTITWIHQKQFLYTGNQTYYMWVFDWNGYISNMNTSVQDLSVLVFKLPTRQFTDPDSITIDNFFDTIGNDLAVILNFIIMILNVLLYPFKFTSYLLTNMLAILGVNTNTSDPQNGLAWLVTFVRDILGSLTIPYV